MEAVSVALGRRPWLSLPRSLGCRLLCLSPHRCWCLCPCAPIGLNLSLPLGGGPWGTGIALSSLAEREKILELHVFPGQLLGCDGLVGGRETQLPPLSWDKFKGIVHTAECPVGSGWDFAWSCILPGPPFLLLLSLTGFSLGQSINKCLAHKSCLGLCRPGHQDNSNSAKPSVGSNVFIPPSPKLQISNSAAAEWVETVSQSEFDSVNQET